MAENRDFQIVATEQTGARKQSLAKADPAATPFKVVIDPKLRLDLRRALIDLIDYHDDALAEHFAEGKLALESYKEYIELFARSLKEWKAAKAFLIYCVRLASTSLRRKSICNRNCAGEKALVPLVRACFK